MQGFGGDDSDVGSPRDSRVQGVTLKPTVDTQPLAGSNVPFSEQLERCGNEVDGPCELATSESQRSMGEILSSRDPGPPHGVSGPDSRADKTSSKLTPSNLNVKRSTFWGRSSVSFDFCRLISLELFSFCCLNTFSVVVSCVVSFLKHMELFFPDHVFSLTYVGINLQICGVSLVSTTIKF